MIAEGSGTRLICSLQEAGLLSFLQSANIQQNTFTSPFEENNSIQTHGIQSYGRAWFHTEITSLKKGERMGRTQECSKAVLKTSIAVLQGNTTMFMIYLVGLPLMDT